MKSTTEKRNYIESGSEVLHLANTGKCILVKQGGIWSRIPAAFIQNWQHRIVMNLIHNRAMAYYTPKPSTKIYPKK